MSEHQQEGPLVLHTRCVTGTGGGPEKTILNSPRYLQPLGFDCACAYLHPPNDEGFELLRNRAATANANLISIPDRGPFDTSVVRALIRYCRENKVAIWHGHDYKTNALGLVARRFWKMKLVTTVHGWVKHTNRTPLYYRIDKFCLPYYDHVICVSEDLYEISRGLGIPADRCTFIPNAIDTIDYQRQASEQRPDSDGRPIVIGGLGRLSVEKGFHHLVNAVDALLREGFSIELRIGGEGDQLEALQQQVADLNRTDEIKILGLVTDPREFFVGLDGFALSSLREGLPNVVLEAMAMEVPVVATRIAGIPGIMEHNKNGWIVEPDSVTELINGLRTLCEDVARRRRWAQTGRTLIEEQYSFRHRMNRMTTIYEELLTQPRAAASA